MNDVFHVVQICNPEWFDAGTLYSVANAPPRAAALKFTGKDLNYAARVLYAEASGSCALPDAAERAKEKSAIINVLYFRINRKGYVSLKHKTFTEVCTAKQQFESVSGRKPKFVNSTQSGVKKFTSSDCSDLEESLNAFKNFLNSGPDKQYCYDNFRAYKKGHPSLPGNRIGNSRFWLSDVGETMNETEK